MKLRIVIPTYNRQEMVISLLEDIFLEDSRVEYIVVDDNSENKSKLLEYYNNNKTHFRLILSDKNHGGAETRNIGWRLEGKVDWIWFLDDDDIVSSTDVLEVLDFLERVTEREEKIVLISSKSLSKGTVLSPETTQLFELFSSKGHQVGTSCCIFHSSLVSTVGGWDSALVAGQDTDLLLRSSYHSDALLIPTIHVTINDNDHARITNNYKKQIKGKFQFLLKNYSLLSTRRKLYYALTAVFLVPYFKRFISL
ncbi:glycosyltransferase [Vibrio parahaemolyticus]|nr:glycosyltransferase [Vibrio parahaemolyticus]